MNSRISSNSQFLQSVLCNMECLLEIRRNLFFTCQLYEGDGECAVYYGASNHVETREAIQLIDQEFTVWLHKTFDPSI